MIYQKIGELKVLPVIAIERVEHALPLADALIEGGLPVAEITFRTEAAADVIQAMKKNRPDLLVGAGTILTVENLKRAIDCGAEFGVAPGFNPDVVEAANEQGFPISPGIMTPSDIEGAMKLGIKTLKFFPAEAAGGIKMLKSLAAPYAHLGVKFIPTGGVTIDNLAEYLSVSEVLAVGGTWVARKNDINEGNFQQIMENCRAIKEVVKSL
jgi:2-dehydro-3-deoxyphosphogluconate aldolase / (4S)-4-hydroxy-2-oxoglutarate aldolase